MIRIAVCDDVASEGQQLADTVQRFLTRRNIRVSLTLYTSADPLLRDLSGGHRFDLLLLDILLGEQNGVELARLLRERGDPVRIIFVTVSPDYAVAGYKVRADDYLLKPVNTDDVEQALLRLLDTTSMVTLRSTAGNLAVVRSEDVMWAEAFDHVTEVHTTSEAITARGTLDEIHQKLGDRAFVRCHRSYLVNLAFIAHITGRTLQLKNGSELPISRGRATALQEAIIRFTESGIHFYTGSV